jgi:hypothetical protein
VEWKSSGISPGLLYLKVRERCAKIRAFETSGRLLMTIPLLITKLLADELAVDPMPETQTLYTELTG